LFIDRPCCPKCQASVAEALEGLPKDVRVTVFYQKTNPDTGEVEYKEFDHATPKADPCG
jgi:hypothetical protein